MPVERAGARQLHDLRGLIDGWAETAVRENPLVAAVDRDPSLDRWYIRLLGEDKEYITVWLTLRELTLSFESYFMPAPEERILDCYEFVLRVNSKLFSWRFALGGENAIYLMGQLPVDSIDADELDRIIGSGYEYSERYFAAAMSIGYASKYRRRRS